MLSILCTHLTISFHDVEFSHCMETIKYFYLTIINSHNHSFPPVFSNVLKLYVVFLYISVGTKCPYRNINIRHMDKALLSLFFKYYVSLFINKDINTKKYRSLSILKRKLLPPNAMFPQVP